MQTPLVRLWIRSLSGLLILALLVAAPFLLAGDGKATPLTDEDIVRGFVTGKSAEELIALIEASRVDFDLSREMVSELRAAGLPSKIIDAMQDRQAAQDKADAPPEAQPEPEEPQTGIVITLNPMDKVQVEAEAEGKTKASADATPAEPKTLRFIDVVPTGLAENLSLAEDQRKITDAAIFLGCMNTMHVPDHWRSKTPLGRDFISAPRHRLLAWVSGAEPIDAGRATKLIGKLLKGAKAADVGVRELAIPESLQAEPELDDTHDLVLGIAMEAGGRFYLVNADAWEGVPQSALAELSAVIEAKGALTPPHSTVRLIRDGATDETVEDAID